MSDVKKAKMTTKEPRDCCFLIRYDVMLVESKSKLISPVEEGVSDIQFYINCSELFIVLHDAHLTIGHDHVTECWKNFTGRYLLLLHDIKLNIHLTYAKKTKRC